MVWLVVLLIVVLLAAVGGGVVYARRERQAPPIEPPAAPSRRATLSAPPVTETPVRPTPAVPVSPELEAEIEDALRDVDAEGRAGTDTVSETVIDEIVVEEALPEAVRPDEALGEEVVVDELVVETTVTHETVTDETVTEELLESEPEPVRRPRFRDRLLKARGLFSGYLGSVRSRSAIDDESWDDLEEALIRADVGVATTQSLLDGLRTRVKTEGIRSPDELIEALKSDLKKRLAATERDLRFERGVPNVWLFVGVNGVGKTTTIGKIGRREAAAGRTVIMAAGDTFRAAAAEQLDTWAQRAGADLVRGNEGGDPGSVIFDAVERAAARNADLVLADTAGRLHTKTNLMEELRKIRRIADKPPGKVTEVLLVLDATTGQNGLVQAQQFKEAADLTGVVLTKLDGSAKGGIALAIQQEFGIPIKLVGLGESVDDLVPFDPDEYIEALFAE